MDHKRVKSLIIVGAGGLGREVAWLVEDINKRALEWEIIGFVDDGVSGNTIEGYPIIGNIDSIFPMKSNVWLIVAIANTQIRKNIINRIQQKDLPLATLIHPSVQSSRYVQIDKGSIICAGSVLTTNVRLGVASIINPQCFIGHDTKLKDFVSLMPGVKVAGEVTLGEGVFIGLNACLINRAQVGNWSIIGAGATVVSDIPSNSLAVGVPARVIKTLAKP